MKIVSLIMLVILTSNSALAETLQFAASIQNEDLAEESILLLHCLAERSGSAWEFSGEASGSHWLELKEKGSAAEGKYHHGKDEAPVRLRVGQAENLCGEIFPDTPPESLAPVTPSPALPNFGAISASPKASYWPWALGAAAVVTVGYALLHSRDRHQGFTMN